MSSIWAKGCMLMIVCVCVCVCVLSDLTCYPSLVEGESHGILLKKKAIENNIWHFISLDSRTYWTFDLSIDLRIVLT